MFFVRPLPEGHYGYGPNLPDYPKLGDFTGFLLIGVNVFSGNNYQGSDLDSITKPTGKGPISTCPSPSTFSLSKFSHLKNADNSDAWTPVPANEVDASRTGWVVATQDVSGGGSSSNITIYAVTNNNGSLVLGSAQMVSVNSFSMPLDAPQKGTTDLLDTSDGRLTNAVASVDPANGNQMAIWTQHSINEDFGSAVAWYEINPSSSALFQHGEIIPPGPAPVYIFNGAISSDRKVNGNGASFGADMAIGFNTSSSSTFVTDDVITQVGSGPPSQFKQVTSSSAAFQQPFACLSTNQDCRWGDYSGASPDPSGTKGAVWFSNTLVDSTGNWKTQNWDAIAGIVTEYPIPTPSSQPVGITKGPDGALWFTEAGFTGGDGNKIGRITTTGTITEFPIPTPSSRTGGITLGPDGALWFAEELGNKIGRITTAGSITEFPVPTPSSQPGIITSGPDGALWFTEQQSNKIGRITTAGSITEFPIPTPSSLPYGITLGPDGALWFAENSANKIGRITTAGSITEFTIPTPSSQPDVITSGPDGALWFTEQQSNKIGRITTAGSITEFPIPTPSSYLASITSGPDGALWFTEYSTNKIGRITTAGSITEFPIPTTSSQPAGITSGPDGDLWFAEYLGNKIGKLIP